MKSKEEIKTTTDFWNDLMKEMWENESGYSFEHFNRAMQEFATQQTAAIQAERDEYRNELTKVCASMLTSPHKKKIIKALLDKYPQQ